MHRKLKAYGYVRHPRPVTRQTSWSTAAAQTAARAHWYSGTPPSPLLRRTHIYGYRHGDKPTEYAGRTRRSAEAPRMAPEIQSLCPSTTAALLLLAACLAAAVAALDAADYARPPLPAGGGGRRVLFANGLGLTPQMG